MLNFALVSLRRSFYDGQKASHGIPDASWRKCVDCDQLVPPRAHHCPLCQRCVLRRDHHCFFTGSCIGFANQRFFIAFCFHCMLGASYGTYITVEYIYIAHMTSDAGLVHFIPPLTALEWLFGFSSFGFLFFVLLMYLCAMAAIGSAGIMIWQLFLVAQGSTSFEYGKGVIRYRTGLLHNFRAVFGSYWMLNFIFPLIWVDIPGDGVNYNFSKCV
ncbi:hypothetical protein CAPTEDRAFT_124229 [Capitella teleta]|uniref:Palmitoyltransferase n=1 Tax=Capitella teleta TaxID=283909 RepID=R7U121_CAPTE|nr:hypothetical protein CAPTEDRAFT_124229 [Capitella teleta]|eukprot:ELT99903.1 hypothetical protein CAPTEDRAFT_124229 [Capitella teleta]